MVPGGLERQRASQIHCVASWMCKVKENEECWDRLEHYLNWFEMITYIYIYDIYIYILYIYLWSYMIIIRYCNIHKLYITLVEISYWPYELCIWSLWKDPKSKEHSLQKKRLCCSSPQNFCEILLVPGTICMLRKACPFAEKWRMWRCAIFGWLSCVALIALGHFSSKCHLRASFVEL